MAALVTLNTQSLKGVGGEFDPEYSVCEEKVRPRIRSSLWGGDDGHNVKAAAHTMVNYNSSKMDKNPITDYK